MKLQVRLALLSLFIPLLLAAEPIQPLERIGIQAGREVAQFVHLDSGEPFFAAGFNYIRLRGSHATFEAETATTEAYYEPQRAEEMFAQLQEKGYNTVRVFIVGRRGSNNLGISGNWDTEGIYEPYMENVMDFLRRATRYNIRVLPTFDDGQLPFNNFFRSQVSDPDNRNLLILSEEGLSARIGYISMFLSYIKDREPELLPTILALQQQNEANLRANVWPFTESSGTFTAANGKTYDLSSTDERQALADEGYQYFYHRLAEAIKAIDPLMLVTEGVYTPADVGKANTEAARGLWPGVFNDERFPPKLTVIGDSALDFLDVHVYRRNPNLTVPEAFEISLTSTGFFTPEMATISQTQPVIIGEWGPRIDIEPNINRAFDNMRIIRDLALENNIQGMLFWTYDTFDQDNRFHARSDWELFTSKLGDFSSKELPAIEMPPHTAQLNLVTPSSTFNRIQLTVNPSDGAATQDTTDVTGTVNLRLNVKPDGTSDVIYLTRDGQVQNTDTRFRSTSFFGLVTNYDLNARNMAGAIESGVSRLPAMNPDGSFAANQHRYWVNTGSLTRAAGTQANINLQFPEVPLAIGGQTGTGNVDLSLVSESGGGRSYNVALTLPVSGTYLQNSAVTISGSGTLRATGTMEVPPAPMQLTWTGAGGNNNWSTVANWSPAERAPRSGDTLIFTGTNATYHNDTTAGNTYHIQFAGCATDITLTGNTVTLNRTLLASNGNQLNLPLLGSGMVSQTGAGAFTLAGNNTHAGGSFISNGNLRVTSGAALGTGPLTLTGGGLSTVGSDTLIIADKDVSLSGAVSFGGTSPDNGIISFSGSNFINLTGHTTVNALSRTDILAAIGQTGANKSLTKTGEGMLVLIGENTFAGGLFINEGTLHTYSRAQALGAGPVNIADGANLRFASSLTYENNIILGEGMPILRTDNESSRLPVLNGRISGVGTMRIQGAGTIALNGANTHTGGVRIESGILELRNPLALQSSVLDTTNTVSGSSSSGLRTTVSTLTLGGLLGNKNLASIFTTNSGGYNSVTALTLNPGVGATHSYSGVIANGASNMSLNFTGEGTQILTGTNTYTGATHVNSGGLIVNGNHTGSGLVTVASGARIGGNGSLAGSLTLAEGASFVFDPNATLTVGGTVTVHSSFSFDDLVATDGGTIDWSTIADGTYMLVTGTVTGFVPRPAFSILPDGRVAFIQEGSLQLVVADADLFTSRWTGAGDGDWGNSANWNNPPDFGAGALLDFHSSDAQNPITFLGAERTIGGLNFNSNVTGDKIIRLYTDALTTSSGDRRSLIFDNGEDRAWLSISSGASGDITFVPSNGAIVLSSDLNITHNGSGILTFNNRFQGSGYRVTLDGTGEVTFNNDEIHNSYGGVSLKSGTLRIAGSRSLGVGSADNASGRPFVMSGGKLTSNSNSDLTLGNNRPIELSGNLTFGGTGAYTGSLTFDDSTTTTLTGDTTFNTVQDLTIESVVSGDHSLTQAGPANLTLTGINTYTGGTTVSGGMLQISGNATLSSGPLTMTGGGLALSSSSDRTISDRVVNLSGSLTFGGVSGSLFDERINIDATTFLMDDVTLNLNQRLDIWSFGESGGSRSLTVNDPDNRMVVFNGSSTFSGGLTVAQGTVTTFSTSLIAFGTGPITMHDGTTLRTTSRTGTHENPIHLVSGNVTMRIELGTNPSPGIRTFTGLISGDGGITKTDTGTLVLNGENTFRGTTVIGNGILELGNDLALQSSVLNTTASVNGTSNAGLRTTVTALTLGGLSGNKNLASVFTTSSGGYSTLTALTLSPRSGATHTYSGAIANGASNMSLNITGAGTQILTGTNTYSGATNVNAGGLIVDGSIGNGLVTVASGARLGGNGSLAGGLTLTSGAQFVFNPNAALTVSGTTTLASGFSVNDLVATDGNVIDWSSIGNGTYTLIAGTVEGIDTTPVALPGERVAFFQEGSLQLVIADELGTAYDFWMNGFGLTDGDATVDADPDGDGIANLLEFVLDGDPTVPYTANLPVTEVNANGDMLFVFIRRMDSVELVDLTFEYSTDLSDWSSQTIPSSSSGNISIAVDTPAAGLETVTITVPASAAPQGRLFGRLRAQY